MQTTLAQDKDGETDLSIRRMLLEMKLPSSGRLPTERELSAELGCSRRTVRRVLDRLEDEGLIWRRQGKGTFVGQPPDPASLLAEELVVDADPLAVMEARLCIEPALAELCARRATPPDVARLRRLAARASGPEDAVTAELWDGAFHRAIARIAGNRLMLTAVALFDDVRSGPRWQLERQKARNADTAKAYDAQHEAIIDSIAAGDGTGAHAAMRAHLELLTRNLSQSLHGDQP